ncbi:MAG: HAD-IA family hydrolase, partial [Rhodospirillaceae bacterium]
AANGDGPEGMLMRGLMDLHGADPDDYLTYVHDIDLSPVQPNPAMDAALAALPGRKLIFTNGSAPHAERVMDKLGVAHHFEAVYDIVAADYRPKPEPAVYDDLVARHGLATSRTVMVEDMARNLKPAHELGMTCIWVSTDSDWARDGHDEDHVHHVVDDLTDWLGQIVG